jgi:hypothetical protein
VKNYRYINAIPQKANLKVENLEFKNFSLKPGRLENSIMILKQDTNEAEGMAQVVQYLPNKRESLD